jgi:hypothetical protein
MRQLGCTSHCDLFPFIGESGNAPNKSCVINSIHSAVVETVSKHTLEGWLLDTFWRTPLYYCHILELH